MNCIKKTILAACVAAATISPFASAALIGDAIMGTGTGLSVGSSTIGNGIEFTGMNGLVNFDFSDNMLTLTVNDKNARWSDLGSYVFSGFDNVITGFSMSPLNTTGNNGFTGFSASDLTFGPHSIALNIGAGFVQNKNSTIAFDLLSTSAVPVPPAGSEFSEPGSEVPEPTSIALLGLGLLAVAAARWKSTKA
jgi:hypothetical protein